MPPKLVPLVDILTRKNSHPFYQCYELVREFETALDEIIFCCLLFPISILMPVQVAMGKKKKKGKKGTQAYSSLLAIRGASKYTIYPIILKLTRNEIL